MITSVNNSITISDNDVTDAEGVLVGGRARGRSYSVNFSIPVVDYQERFEEERERLADIVRSDKELSQADLRMLVLVGNKVVWQESKQND
jgi:hypothetical protein